jgi:hypothetical protein
MHAQENAEVRDTLLCAGGLALMVFGAGMILANPGIRQTLMAAVTPLLPELKEPLSQGLSGLLPDIERYMKIRAM